LPAAVAAATVRDFSFSKHLLSESCKHLLAALRFFFLVFLQIMKLSNYMETFPFPFYVVIRDVESLPLTLSDALRQWFELVTAADH
jgi:hypothetical protein